MKISKRLDAWRMEGFEWRPWRCPHTEGKQRMYWLWWCFQWKGEK